MYMYYVCVYVCMYLCIYVHTVCPRRNGQNFGTVFLMLKYTDITQNTYIQNLNGYGDNGHRKVWASGGGPRSVRRPLRHIRTLRMPGNETS